MDIGQIAVFGAASFVGSILPVRLRAWFLIVVSVISIYWLQPTLDIRWVDYSLPTITLIMGILGWFIVQRRLNDPCKPNSIDIDDWLTLATIVGISLLLNLTRYVELPVAITSRPPPMRHMIAGILVVSLLIFLVRTSSRPKIAVWLAIGVLTVLLIITRNGALIVAISQVLRHQSGQDVALAAVTDFQWLGFSYFAFRLIHTLRDHQNGILPALRLREYLTYLIFFPTYTAGPIDRVERFVQDYRVISQLEGRDATHLGRGATRILIGLFKKFVLADSLALFSLNAVLAAQANTPFALWGMLYAYAFRLYFDFSGYSDIAIGLGTLYGINLPENFARPYLKNNITLFWQSWHITLSNWVRSYVYSPLSRSLLRRKVRLPTNVIILTCTLATMIVITLWHGISLTFLIWGLWHGIGLFIHKLWSDQTRQWQRRLKDRHRQQMVWHLVGTVITFHFIVLGWVWFALPDVNIALKVLVRLFGTNL